MFQAHIARHAHGHRKSNEPDGNGEVTRHASKESLAADRRLSLRFVHGDLHFNWLTKIAEHGLKQSQRSQPRRFRAHDARPHVARMEALRAREGPFGLGETAFWSNE